MPSRRRTRPPGPDTGATRRGRGPGRARTGAAVLTAAGTGWAPITRMDGPEQVRGRPEEGPRAAGPG